MISILRAPWWTALALGVLVALVALPSEAGPVNINTADATTLARELKGIGLKRAQAIVDYRTKYGPFKSPDELALVKGIGARAIEQNRTEIRTETKGATPVAGATRKPARTP